MTAWNGFIYGTGAGLVLIVLSYWFPVITGALRYAILVSAIFEPIRLYKRESLINPTADGFVLGVTFIPSLITWFIFLAQR